PSCSFSGDIYKGCRPFCGRTERPIDAEIAVKPGPWLKIPFTDLCRDLFHFSLRGFQLCRVASREHQLISVEIVETHPIHLISPLLVSRQRVDGQLQTAVSIPLMLWLARFVVDECN